MRNRIIGAIAVGAAGVGLLLAGSGVAAADPSCLEESLRGAAADPFGALGGVLSDPAGSAQADLKCIEELLDH